MGFPTKKFINYSLFHEGYKEAFDKAYSSLNKNNIEKILNIIKKNYKSKNKIIVCGNGGSAALSNHFACDHQKILSSCKKLRPYIISLNSNNSIFSAIANDINYKSVFSEQLKQIGEKGDLLITISSSGKSPNIIQATKIANKLGIKTISLTGFNGGTSKKISYYNIHVRSDNYGIIESVHHCVMNLISQYIRNTQLSENVIKKTNF